MKLLRMELSPETWEEFYFRLTAAETALRCKGHEQLAKALHDQASLIKGLLEQSREAASA